MKFTPEQLDQLEREPTTEDGLVTCVSAESLHKVVTRARDADRYEEALKEFKIHASDGCSGCEYGRVTMFVKSSYCIECQNKHRAALGKDKP